MFTGPGLSLDKETSLEVYLKQLIVSFSLVQSCGHSFSNGHAGNGRNGAGSNLICVGDCNVIFERRLKLMLRATRKHVNMLVEILRKSICDVHFFHRKLTPPGSFFVLACWLLWFLRAACLLVILPPSFLLAARTPSLGVFLLLVLVLSAHFNRLRKPVSEFLIQEKHKRHPSKPHSAGNVKN